MSDQLILSEAGEESPAVPPIPGFLRRFKEECVDEAAVIDPATWDSIKPIKTNDLPHVDDTDVVEIEPSEEDIISLIRKLAAKRDKLDETIAGLKEQLIGKVKRL